MFVRNPNDVWIYTLILASSALLSNLVLFSFLKKYIVRVKITWKDIARHIKPNLTMFLPVIAVSIYNVMDKIMLGIMSSVAEVGYYENAEKIKGVCLSLITALGVVSLPRVSNMISMKQHREIEELIKKTMKFSLFLAVPMVAGLVCVGQDFANIFFGWDFSKSGILLQLLSTTLLFMAWGNIIRTQYLIPYEKDKIYVKSAFIGAIVNFVCNLILIPFLSSVGACLGTIAAEAAVTIYQSIKVRRQLPLYAYLRDSFGFLVKAIIMAVIVIIVGLVVTNPIAKIICQVIVGGLAYMLLNVNYLEHDLGFFEMFIKLPRRISKKGGK